MIPKYDYPDVTVDQRSGREWVHLEPPRFYLYWRKDEHTWVVIDRVWDLALGRAYKRKADAVRYFRRKFRGVDFKD